MDEYNNLDYDALSVEELQDEITKLETSYYPKTKAYLSPNHRLEIYLFEIYIAPNSYDLTKHPMHQLYYKLAGEWMIAGNYEKAEASIIKALTYNALDMELYERYILILYHQKKWRAMIDTALSFYPYCYTKKDMAFYYRTIGAYALETYQAELARVLYAYSDLLETSTEAKKAISYLNEAMENEMPNYTLDQFHSILKENSLPVKPADDTLAIIYHTAELAKDNNPQYAELLQIILKDWEEK